jgi:hypothetical protein
MHTSVKKMLEQFGSRIRRSRQGENVYIRGFLQHSASVSQQNLKQEYSPLGRVPGGRYVLIVPADADLARGDMLEDGRLRVKLCRLETVYFQDKPLYQWGLCEGAGGADVWAERS